MENRKIQVGIVEDDPQKLQMLKEKINQTEDLQCKCSFNNAEDALISLPKLNPEIVIMDIGLPHMNGVECMFRVKRKCPDMAFIMFTVFAKDENLFDSLRFGAEGYVLKREGAHGIIRAIRNYFEGGAPMSPEIARKVLKSFRPGNTENLTPRQIVILEELCKGLQNKEIAARLFITEGSVKVQLARIYKKLEVNNRVEAINKFQGR